MCVTAVIAGVSLLASAGAAYSRIQANNANSRFESWKAKERTKELKADAENATIAAMDRENARAREFNRLWSTSMAAIGASGVSEHISFFQGIGPESMRQMNTDVRAIRLGMVTERERIGSQIGVVGYGSRVAKHNARMGNIGALAQFANEAMSAASYYHKNG